MKKIFTLLFASVMLTTAFAQYGSKDDRDFNNKKDFVINDNNKYSNNDFRGGKYYFTPRERDMQIAQIKREYDFKIQAVRNKFLMNSFQKKRQIEFLKTQREKEVYMVMAKFNDRKNQWNDHGYDKKKKW